MRRRRKPVAKPIAAATEAVIWRGRMLCEMLEAVTLPPQLEEPIRRMLDALDDYEASRVQPNGASPIARDPMPPGTLLPFAEER